MLKSILQSVIVFVFLCLSLQTFGQEKYYKQMSGNNRIIISSADSVIYAWFSRDENKKINADEDKYYYWVSNNDIKRTRGGYDGKILHGDYIVYYSNKDLRTKGAFKYGLKEGVWKSWHKGGEIKSKEKWHKGELVGIALYYFPNGKIQRERRSKGIKGDAIILTYNEDGKLLLKQYYKKHFLIKEKTFQINDKGKSVEIKPEKKSAKKSKSKDTKPQKEKRKKKSESDNVPEGKKQKKVKQKKSPKIKVQRFRQIVPGGQGA